MLIYKCEIHYRKKNFFHSVLKDKNFLKFFNFAVEIKRGENK